MSEYDVQKFDAVQHGYVGNYALKVERAHYKREAERLSYLCKNLQEKIKTLEKALNKNLT